MSFALGSQPLSVGPQRFTPDLHGSQLSEQLRCFAKRGARLHLRLPAGQPSARTLPQSEPQRPICTTPALPTRTATVPVRMNVKQPSMPAASARQASSTPCSCTSRRYGADTSLR